MIEYDEEAFTLLQKQVEEGAAEQAKIAAQIRQAQELVRQLERQKLATYETLKENRIAVRQLEQEKIRRDRLRAAEEKRDNLQRQYEENAKKLDELTKHKAWREHAFPYQVEGAKRLAIAKRGILADKRGLGKTLTSLITLDMMQSKRIVLLAINDVVPQFEEEIRIWQPERTIFSLRGLPKSQREMIYPMLNMVDEWIVTLNFEAWRRDKTVIDKLVAAGVDTVIIDEAHKIKTHNKITARGAHQIILRPNKCNNCGIGNHLGPWERPSGLVDFKVTATCPTCSGQLTSTVENVMCLTGTPILNKPQELFSMLHAIDPVAFEKEGDYLKDYCVAIGPNRWRFLDGGLARLQDRMAPFFVQRTREQAGITLPPPKVTVHYLQKDKEKYPLQYKAEEDLTKNAALVLQNGDTVPMLYILEIMLRERQVMTWPSGIVLKDPETKEVICRFDVQESQKLDAVTDLLTDLIEEGERTVVFSKFKDPLYELARRFPERTTLATGDQTKHHKEQVRLDFDLKTAPKNPKWDAVFATYDAFGTGLNLNGARHLIMIDDEWNPGSQDQAIGRIDRLNSTHQANVHIFRVEKSIDIFMESLIQEKREIVEGFEGKFLAAELLDHLKAAK